MSESVKRFTMYDQDQLKKSGVMGIWIFEKDSPLFFPTFQVNTIFYGSDSRHMVVRACNPHRHFEFDDPDMVAYRYKGEPLVLAISKRNYREAVLGENWWMNYSLSPSPRRVAAKENRARDPMSIHKRRGMTLYWNVQTEPTNKPGEF